jgi:hypothetical protein
LKPVGFGTDSRHRDAAIAGTARRRYRDRSVTFLFVSMAPVVLAAAACYSVVRVGLKVIPVEAMP